MRKLEQIEYRGLKIVANKASTIKVYAQLESCADGQVAYGYKTATNYSENRELFFPKRLVGLITSLGIDYHKENEFISYETEDLDIIEI